MKTRHATTGLTAMVMVAILGALAILAASPVEAVIAIIRTTGLFGIAQGQVASAHVVNTGEVRGFVVDWKVLDSEGNLLAQSERQPLALGHASSFNFGPLDLARGQRTAIRVVLAVEGGSNNPDKPDFTATQEVFDTDTGKTTFTASFEDCACGAQ